MAPAVALANGRVFDDAADVQRGEPTQGQGDGEVAVAEQVGFLQVGGAHGGHHGDAVHLFDAAQV
ncbi:hypothetical protein D9M69_717650 [compost metagenome]